MNYYLKNPGASLDYSFDWSPYVAAGQTIAASRWKVLPVEPGGVTALVNSFASTTALVELTGGVAGRVYRITNQVNFSDGRADERTVELRVEDR